MPEPKRPLKVFLCHAHDDKLKTRELYRYLRKRGIQPWLDAEDLVGGQDWRVEIPKAIKTSDAIIICLSKNSINKEGFVQAEITFALEKALEIPPGRIFIIPARFEDCEVPDNLERFHYVDLFEENGFPRLMKSLKTRAGQLERFTVQVPQSDESSPDLNSASEEKIESEAAEKTTHEKAEKETAEKIWLEAEEQEKQKAAKEKAEREITEKIAREKVEQEVAEKTRLEAEELAIQKSAEEKAEREVAEKVAREKVERQAAQRDAIKKLLSKVVPFLRIIGIIGIIIVLFWVGSLTVSKFSSLISTPKASVTQSDTLQGVSTNSPIVPTKNSIPTTAPTKRPTPTPVPEIGSTMIANTDSMILLYVPSGEFTMGSDKYVSNINADERPMHKVTLPSFWMDQTEVTNKMYALCVNAGVCQPLNFAASMTRDQYYDTVEFAEYPVLVGSDWNKAKTYCDWAGRRLPTEAEWEKAARGTDARIYPWGNETPTGNLANYNSMVGDTTKVGSYPAGASLYGVLDMAGNVWEWVSSLYASYPYSATDGRENLNTDGARVLRGGSWLDSAYNVRSGVRPFGIPPIDNTLTIGFRCARDANP